VFDGLCLGWRAAEPKRPGGVSIARWSEHLKEGQA
jgi:hypothetical protein